MRKKSALGLIVLMLIMMQATTTTVWAATNGADAQSPSMSAGADGKEVVNETEDEGAGEADYVHPIDGDLSEAADPVEVEDATEEDIAAEENAQAEAERTPIIRVVVAIAVALTALLAAIMLLRSKRKDDKKYKSKH